MQENRKEGTSVGLVPSPNERLSAPAEGSTETDRRKALADRLKRMATRAKQDYIEATARIGLNNSVTDCDDLRRMRWQWKMVEEAARLAEEQL